MKIRFARTAQISLHEAIDHIRQDNPIAARHFLQKVERTIRRLERYPNSGRRIPEFPDLPYRELPVPPYRFFYRVEPKTIFIVAVWHDAQIPMEPEKTKVKGA